MGVIKILDQDARPIMQLGHSATFRTVMCRLLYAILQQLTRIADAKCDAPIMRETQTLLDQTVPLDKFARKETADD